MSEVSVAGLDVRVTALEKTVPEGLRRIEELIQREIHDLKREQIGDIKSALGRVETDTKNSLDRIERSLSKEIERIADDQRRLWEAVSVLQKNDNTRTGGSRTFDRMWNVASLLIGCAITLTASWLASGHLLH